MPSGHGQALWSWRDAPGLDKAIDAGPQWLRDRADGAIPTAPSVYAFADGALFRPPGSHRAFYEMARLADSGAAPGVLAYKGTEPAIAGLDGLLAHFGRAEDDGAPSVLERLILGEGKVPGAVTAGEAMREAQAGARIQIAFCNARGEAPRLPLPLHVTAHPPTRSEALRAMIAPFVSAPAREALDRLLEDDLAILTYAYPGVPLRVRDTTTLFAGQSGLQRLFGLTELCNPAAIVDRWLDLFGRIARLGFLPGTPASLRTGLCCQPQNACIDGGFVDLDSLSAIADLPDDNALAAALHISLGAMIDTIAQFLLPPGMPTDGMARHHIRSFVLDRIRTALAADGPGRVDPRLLRFLVPAPDAATLLDQLARVAGRSDPRYMKAVLAFGEAGNLLLRLTR